MRAISSMPKLHAMVMRDPGGNLLDELRLLTSEVNSSLQVNGERHPAILRHLLLQLHAGIQNMRELIKAFDQRTIL